MEAQLLAYLSTLSQQHLVFDSLPQSYNYIVGGDTRLFIVARDYENLALVLPYCVTAEKKNIPHVFVPRGEALANVARTGVSYVPFCSIVNVYNDGYLDNFLYTIRHDGPNVMLPPAP